MGKSTDRNVAAEQEFASLEQVLNQTADDTSSCLKLLKKRLSEYDSRHSNHFVNTAKSFMRSDMRTAKDTASDLKHVAHQISKSHKPSQAEVSSARNMMDATARVMDVLKTTARNYDQKNGHSSGVKGVIYNVVGKDDKEKPKESKGGLFGKSDKKDEKQGGLFGKSEKEKEKDNHGGILGMGDKDKDKDGNHGGGILSGPDTVESLVKSTLRDNFNLSPLSHQITAAEKSLTSSPSIVEKAKEAMHDVKDKLKGDKNSPTHEGHHATHAVNP